MLKQSHKQGLYALITGFSLFFTPNILAANDGDLNQESTGDLTVRAIINPAVQISKLQDIDLNIDLESNSSRYGTSAACIYNSNGVDYNITASTTDGSFILKNSTANTIHYAVQIDDTSGQDFTNLHYGSKKVRTNASNSLNCNGSTNAAIRVIASKADVISAGAGVFSSILYLTIETI